MTCFDGKRCFLLNRENSDVIAEGVRQGKDGLNVWTSSKNNLSQ